MSDLNQDQQIFVLYQIRNWVFGHYAVFDAMNTAWAKRDAQAYFWN